MSKMDDWDAWKETLGKAVNLGKTVGMSDHTITNVAENIGTFLSGTMDPRNKEERLLKELWDVSDENDRHTLAKLVTKITDK
ncbi:MAG: hypothetical protein K0Q97_2889 [Bacillota bacterium]|jgi:hypothetical protein|nr:hypothetical protein [Bacillota bacterium]